MDLVISNKFSILFVTVMVTEEGVCDSRITPFLSHHTAEQDLAINYKMTETE